MTRIPLLAAAGLLAASCSTSPSPTSTTTSFPPGELVDLSHVYDGTTIGGGSGAPLRAVAIVPGT